ncbi:MAG: hypothetical protein B6I18_01615 [Bacteroidetes bacterium 4572_112]|nr:MAG: hypothetical protein B6I18_01615 [Bacteroidetes bacterium 4572_112]
MKYILFVLFIMFFASASSQTDASVRLTYVSPDYDVNTTNKIMGSNIYKVRLRLNHNDRRTISGYLWQTKDSSLAVYEPINIYTNYGDYLANNFYYKIWSVDVNRIKAISYRRNNSIGNGALIGAGVGVLSGLAIGLIWKNSTESSSPNYLDDEVLIYYPAMVLIIPGAIIGALIGSNYKTMTIEGQKTIYDNYKKELKDFSITN